MIAPIGAKVKPLRLALAFRLLDFQAKLDQAADGVGKLRFVRLSLGPFLLFLAAGLLGSFAIACIV